MYIRQEVKMEPFGESTKSVITPSSSLNSLKQCSICLENYSRPKVLPCQHTYCYSCLVNIASGQSGITCPECREEHLIPESGVSGFRDSLVINQLLCITLPNSDYCADCKAEAVVSQCEHCQTCICTQCLVQHAKLCIEISTSVAHLQEELISPDAKKTLQVKKSQLQTSRDDLEKEYRNQITVLENQLKELKVTLERVSSLSDFVKSSIRIHDDLIAISTGKLPYDSYFSSLACKTDDCKTSDSLRRLREELKDFKTVSRLIKKNSDSFKFSLDIKKHDLTEKSLRVQYGQSLVDVRGMYERDALIKRLHEIEVGEISRNCGLYDDNIFILDEAPAKSDFTAEERKGVVVRNGGFEKDEEEQKKKALGTKWETIPEDENDWSYPDIEDKIVKDEQFPDEIVPHESATHHEGMYSHQQKPTKRRRRRYSYSQSSLSPAKSVSSLDALQTTQSYRQNQLPNGVDHSTLGQNAIIIGERHKFKLSQPYSCAYHVVRDRIFVADNGNDKIVSYSVCGKESRMFHPHLYNPRDIAVVSNGKFICLMRPTGIFIVHSASKRLHGSYKVCSLGEFKDCRSLLYHGTQLIVVERKYRSLIVFKDGTEVRHFGRDHLKQPSMIAYNPSKQLFYVTDLHLSCVKVFTWEGSYVETFAALAEDNDISGIAVDVDDYVYVARVLSHRVDIYNPRRKLIRSISSEDLQYPLKSPNKLCLMPDGRLIVADTGNDRLQILG